MLAPTILFDTALLHNLWASALLICSVLNTKSVGARPQSPARATRAVTRTVIKDKITKTIILVMPYLYTGMLVLGLLPLLFTCHLECAALVLYANVSNHTWLYALAVTLTILLTLCVYAARLHIFQLSAETTLAVILIFLCAQFYYLLTNPFILIVLLECQSIALLLFIAASGDHTLTTQTNATQLTVKLTTNTPATNMLTLQFWIAFFGAALLLLSTSYLMITIGAGHWYDLTRLLILHQLIYTHTWALKGALVIFILGLLLKIGAFPLHFWKPELYNNLHLTGVLVYAGPYSTAVLLLIIWLLHVTQTICPTTAQLLITANILVATYVLLALLLFITEMKAFLAYTSGLHVLYVYAAMLLDILVGASATLYVAAYFLATLTVFSALLNFRQLSIKYLTDLQIFAHLPTSVIWIGTGVATMAGVPPLLGFWVKFNVLYNLWYGAESLIAGHLLSTSMAYMYFYIALYRFSGATNFKISPARTAFIKQTIIANLGLITTALHLVGPWHVHDAYNTTALYALHIHDYV